jgi:hypothetical protein
MRKDFINPFMLCDCFYFFRENHINTFIYFQIVNSRRSKK